MARPLRIEFPGAVYHVMSRGNNRAAVFIDEADRWRFLELLGRCASRFGLEILAFCLMDNHFHLFLRTPLGNLSRAMHWLLGSYTVVFNRRHQRDGHLFRGRYRAVMVDGEAHWLHLSAYLHLNPVRAGLVDDPAQWEWSSFRDYVRARPRFEWLTREPVLASWGPGAPGRRRYGRRVRALAGAEPSWSEAIREAMFLGERKRYEQLREQHGPSGRPADFESWGAGIRGPVDPEAELARVAQIMGTTVDRMMCKGKRQARIAAYYHLVHHCGLTQTRVAELFGVSIAAVSDGMKKFTERMADDRGLMRTVQGLNFKLKL